MQGDSGAGIHYAYNVQNNITTYVQMKHVGIMSLMLLFLSIGVVSKLQGASVNACIKQLTTR